MEPFVGVARDWWEGERRKLWPCFHQHVGGDEKRRLRGPLFAGGNDHPDNALRLLIPHRCTAETFYDGKARNLDIFELNPVGPLPPQETPGGKDAIIVSVGETQSAEGMAPDLVCRGRVDRLCTSWRLLDQLPPRDMTTTITLLGAPEDNLSSEQPMRGQQWKIKAYC